MQPPKIDRYSYNRTTYNRLFWVFMFIRAYLRASTKDQDANRAKDGVSTEFGENSTLSIAQIDTHSLIELLRGLQ